MTMEIPQFVHVLQPLAEFVKEHRKEIDDAIYKLATTPLRYPISDELRRHIVINSCGPNGLYALWRKTAKLRRVS